MSLEDEEHSGQSSDVDNDQLKAIIEAEPLKSTWEIAEKFIVDHPMVICHLKQIEKVKSHSISGCLMGWLKIKKNLFEISSSLILHYKNKPLLRL